MNRRIRGVKKEGRKENEKENERKKKKRNSEILK
jgi:hypothetical protein